MYFSIYVSYLCMRACRCGRVTIGYRPVSPAGILSARNVGCSHLCKCSTHMKCEHLCHCHISLIMLSHKLFTFIHCCLCCLCLSTVCKRLYLVTCTFHICTVNIGHDLSIYTCTIVNQYITVTELLCYISFSQTVSKCSVQSQICL